MTRDRSPPPSSAPPPRLGARAAPGGPLGPAARRRLLLARLALLVERAWPLVLPPLGVLGAFVALAWAGLFVALPGPGRAAGLALAGLALVVALLPLRRLRLPTTAEAAVRLDRDGPAHRPLATLADRPAAGAGPEALALWRLHQERAARAAAAQRVRPPEPALRRRDPLALRLGLLAALLAAAFAAGPEREGRLLAAFDLGPPPVPVAPPRLDAWVDPPAYTGRPPLFLARAGQERSGQERAEGAPRPAVPVGSVLVVRAAPGAGFALEGSGGLKVPEEGAGGPPAAARPREAAPSGAFEGRLTVTGAGEAVLRRGGGEALRLALDAVPDRPPTVELTEAGAAERGDGLRLRYRTGDDYGVAEAEARFAVPPPAAGGAPRRTLVETPRVPLPLGGRGAEGAPAEGETTADLADHPLAGARLRLTLHARDDANQWGASEARDVVIPARPFSNPLAKALVEQRRALALDPEGRDKVALALDALMIAPERFTPTTSTYLGLRLAASRLRAARADPALVEVAEWLWRMALAIDGEGLSDAEKQLRAAQERLREAVERGAAPEELKRLAEDLKRAMDNFMRELAEQAERDPSGSEQADAGRSITQQDLKRLVERAEELARSGDREGAQRLLEQLKEMMKNLRAAREKGQDGRGREAAEALDELDRLSRDQGGLRDRTFREGQEREDRARRERGQQGRQGQQGGQQPGQRGRQGQGQQGQGQQGQGQQGQGQQGQRGQGQGPGEGEQQAEGGEGQGQGQGLGERQGGLRERLEALRRRARELGLSPEQGLEDAEGAMREAERQLGRGAGRGAVDAQGRAIEGLRRGAQGLAQQLQGEGEPSEQAGDDGNGEARPGQPRPGTAGRDTDPLGRPTRSREASDGRVRVPEAGEQAAERAGRVLEELRRRLGEPTRPQGELDYLERLLPR